MIFLLVPPQKVLSVEDGKIPTKKVKVGLFNSKMLSFNSDFHFFGRDLPSSTLRTFWGGTSQKNHHDIVVEAEDSYSFCCNGSIMGFIRQCHGFSICSIQRLIGLDKIENQIKNKSYYETN